MLSDRDRTLLAPHLALLRAARKELAAAEREFAAAEQDRASTSSRTDWRDRLFGGVLSVDEGRAQQYRRSRKSTKTADKTLAEARARYEKYAERVDSLFEPMLLLDDAGYRAKVDAVRACDKALKACEQMRFRIASALARPEPKQNWHEAEFARQRSRELITALQEDEPRVRRLVERAGPVRVDLEVKELRKPEALVGLQRQLDALIREVTEWRARAERDRVAALRAAHELL